MEGPVNFNDETLRRAHVHLGIKRAEFLEIVGLMRRALEGNGMSAPDVDHVVRAVMRREPLIVSEAEGGAPPTG
jgi:hypothetical protein